MIDILLQPCEIELAAVEAVRDFSVAVTVKQPESHGKLGSQADWLASRIIGKWGEFAFEKAAGLVHVYHNIYAPDNRIAEIRTVSKDSYGLMYRRADCWKAAGLPPECGKNPPKVPDSRKFVLISSQHFPILRLLGWLTGDELRTDACWKKGLHVAGNGREQTYIAINLHPIIPKVLQDWVSQLDK